MLIHLGHKDAKVTATIYAQVTAKQSREASNVFAAHMGDKQPLLHLCYT